MLYGQVESLHFVVVSHIGVSICFKLKFLYIANLANLLLNTFECITTLNTLPFHISCAKSSTARMVLIISIFFRKLDGWMSYDGMSSTPSRWLWPWILSIKTTLSLQALTEMVRKSSPAWWVSQFVASLKNLEHSLSYEGMSWYMTLPLECYILSKITVLSMETPTGTTVR